MTIEFASMADVIKVGTAHPTNFMGDYVGWAVPTFFG